MTNYSKRVGMFLMTASLLATLGSTFLIAYIGITDRMNDTHYVQL